MRTVFLHARCRRTQAIDLRFLNFALIKAR